MSVRIPKYLHHKTPDHALVQICGRRIYFGKHGTEEFIKRMCGNQYRMPDNQGANSPHCR